MTTAPVVHGDGTVEPAGPDPSRVVLLVEYPSGAFREFTALEPLEWRMAVAPSDGKPRSEPKIALMLAGNPDTGGIQVRQEGMA